MRSFGIAVAAAGVLYASAPSTAAEVADVLETYADIALAEYEDSLTAARS